MNLNPNIKFVLQDKNVILLDLTSEQFFLLTDDIDYLFFSDIEKGENVNNALKKLKNHQDYQQLITEYKNFKILEN